MSAMKLGFLNTIMRIEGLLVRNTVGNTNNGADKVTRRMAIETG